MTVCGILSLFATLWLVTLASAADNADCGLNKPFQITTRAALLELATSSALVSGPTCPEEIIIAIKELNLIVDDNENVCSQEKADRIRDFHTIYLTADKQRAVKLPKPVKQFFIGYALKVSQQCRRLAIENLVSASNSLLKPQDFEVIDRFTSGEGLLAKLISEPSDQDKLVLPRNLIKLMRSHGQRVNQEKLFLQMSTIGTVGAMKLFCASKFKPIYEKLLLPLFTISSTGYNFQNAAGDLSKTIAAEERNQVGKQVFQWYRIVLLCEVLENVELIRAGADETSNLIRVLSKKEAGELRRSSPQLFFNGQQGEIQEDEPVTYEPNYATAPQIDDLVLDASDKALIKKIKSFKSGNVVGRFLRKVNHSIKEQLSKGLAHLAISKNAMVFAGGRQVTSANDLIKVIDDYIYDEQRLGESSVSAKRDIKFELVFYGFWVAIFTFAALIIAYLAGGFGPSPFG